MNELQTTNANATETFRAVASDRLIAAAQMTPHELLDEFMRLSKIVAAGTTQLLDEDEGYPSSVKFTDEAKLAFKEIGVINGTSKARFGFVFYASTGDDF